MIALGGVRFADGGGTAAAAALPADRARVSLGNISEYVVKHAPMTSFIVQRPTY